MFQSLILYFLNICWIPWHVLFWFTALFKILTRFCNIRCSGTTGSIKSLSFDWIYFTIDTEIVSWSEQNSSWLIWCFQKLSLHLSKLRVSPAAVNYFRNFQIIEFFTFRSLKISFSLLFEPSKWGTQEW